MKTNQELRQLITNMKNNESKLLRRIANDLAKPNRQRREVNLSRINRFTKDNEIVIVPGKVLGGGEIDHKVVISALKFSDSALEKLKQNGSTIMMLNELKEENVVGKRVRIIG